MFDQISGFGKKFYFYQNFRFWRKLYIYQNFSSLRKTRCLSKISAFDRKLDFLTKFQVLAKFYFYQKFNILQKTRFLKTKFQILAEKLIFISDQILLIKSTFANFDENVKSKYITLFC